MPHKPVLLTEVLEHLSPKAGEIYVDATFGAGGYSAAILGMADCSLYSIDRDADAKKFGDKLSDKYPDNFHFLAGKFSDMETLLSGFGVSEVDGIVFDLGVSSMQFDDKERGFSFDSDARLDMRMDQQNPLSAYEVINEFDEVEIAKIVKEFGEEPKAKQIAKKIAQARASKPITSCRELADIVRSLYFGYFKTDPATRTFQAIRIFVNQELEEITQALHSAKKLLRKDGRLIVVSFHSLEDSIVKSFLKKEAGIDKPMSRYQPILADSKSAIYFNIINKSAIKPSDEEVRQNYRARSSRMRVAIKI